MTDDDPTFLDALRPSTARVSRTIRAERMSECRACEHFFAPTSQCRQCGCVMVVKTTLAGAECPLGKWNRVVET
jgi:hypothetical protein